MQSAWDALRAAAPAERVYSFAIYTSGEWSYLMATGNTEEGLRRVAGDEPEAVADHRWSYADSEFHGALPSL
ncbi:MAG: DUF4303 domain-containing protein, partial [Planctomycetota bacterium]